MTSWDLTLASRREVAQGTLAFRFGRPGGLRFRAGQAVDLVLPAASGEPGARHAFSLASAPFEDHLEVATRMRDSPFKRALGKLVPGDTVACDGPFGSFRLPSDPGRDALLVAGGIGITPFMSLLKQAARDGGPRRLCLVYSCRRRAEAAYLDELERFAGSGMGLRLIPVMTREEDAAGREGFHRSRVNAAVLDAALSGLRRPLCLVAGPPALVAAVRDSLSACGVADDDLRDEAFHGY